ncbi:MAG: CBS domain-containing protein [Anaerolineae bacterium]
MASVGFVAVFAGASNTPLACTLMGLELFGGGAALYVALGCFVAYLASGHRGIYVTQLVDATKAAGFRVEADESLASVARRRGGWLPLLNARLADLRVSSIMSPRPVTVKPDMSIVEMVNTAKRGGVRTLPVVDAEQRLVGIVTDRDLQRIGVDTSLSRLKQMDAAELANILHDVLELSVKDVMTPGVVTLEQDTAADSAVDLMLKRQLKRVPVVDVDKRLVGIITRSDILREYVFMESANGEESLKVGQVNLAAAVTLTPDTPAAQLKAVMQSPEHKRIVVVDKTGSVVGIVTDSDLQRKSNTAQTVGEMMTQPVYTVTPATPVKDALRLLIEHQIKRLPVLGEDQHVLGLVGRAELMRVLLETQMQAEGAA